MQEFIEETIKQYKQGLILSEDILSPEYDGHAGYFAGMKFFSITWDEVLYLFNVNNYFIGKITPEDVAARVQELIKQYG